MEQDREQLGPADLGPASRQTLGGDGEATDLVRYIPKTGISDE